MLVRPLAFVVQRKLGSPSLGSNLGDDNRSVVIALALSASLTVIREMPQTWRDVEIVSAP